ncbi:Hypothetical predicted protein [Mytilus galloprovincialis]|uniref:Reverse transcriptase domain-containing protein n=1 Tax=Mytilus galloprovincialis TaxID=29158 RepID=A0A8B6HUK9_MYTGA|nr:Hypothetical predicted protein [Mytilus galloprovincialis]
MSSDPGSLMAFQRERKLNPKGQEQYTLQTEKYLDKLRKLKRDIDSYIFSIDVNHLPDQQQVRQIRQDVIDRFYAFTQESTRFILFLQGTRTKESNQEESGHRLIVQSLKSKVDNFIAIIDEHLHNPNVSKKEKKNSVKSNPQLASAMKLAKQASVKSSPTVKKERKSSVKSHRVSKKSDLDYHSTKTRRSSLESFTSHASEMLVKEQVKLEAAKVRLKYTEQEQELTRQKAALDANLEKLVREREVDEAESKVRTIQEALQGSGEDSSTENSDVNDDFVLDRTEQFVIQDSYERLSGKDKILDTDSKLNDVTIIQTVADVHATHDDCNNNKVNKIVQDIKPVQTINVVKSGQMMKTGPELTKKNVQNVHYGKIIDTVQETNHDKTLNAEAPVFIPSTKEVNMCDEFSRFMNVKRYRTNRHEIPSQELARKFDHLKDIAQFIQPIQSDVSIELLIGRDLISSHYVLDHRIGKDGLPYAQKLPLGWVILGETCLGKVHYPDIVHVHKTHVLEDGRATFFKPCEYELKLKSDVIFTKTPYDENIGLAVEDKDFLDIMDANFEQDKNGQWTVPLPFKVNRQPLQSNSWSCTQTSKSFDYSLSKDERKAKHVTDFMQRMIDNNHAEEAPTLKSGKEHWKETIAITCDVEQMFYNFKVREDHRDFLRFLWHKQNDLSKPLTDFRMNVHVFGNRPSPAIATYGFRKTVENEDQDVRDFVNDHFYVDDGLISCQNISEAVSLIKRTQSALWDRGKDASPQITSNSTELLEQFDSGDLAKGLKDLDLSSDELPTQRSLGVSWI